MSSRLRSRAERRRNVHRRIRNKIQGAADRPRLSVFRSLKHTYAQMIDDQQGKTLLVASTLKLGDAKLPNGGNISAAKDVGKEIAKAAQKQGIKKVVFDRGGYVYHGRVKALAEGAREGGLEF